MFAVNTYEEIEKREREINEQHIIVLLFVKPSLKDSKEIIEEFDYIHYNSDRFCSIYAVGYSNDFNCENDKLYKKIQTLHGDWYFNTKKFVEFKDKLEKRIKWKYSGEIEVLVLQSNPYGKEILNFQNYVAIDINHGIKKEYVESFPKFMESLVRASKSDVEVKETMRKVSNHRLSIKGIIEDTIQESKRVPLSIRKILGDRYFYRYSK